MSAVTISVQSQTVAFYHSKMCALLSEATYGRAGAVAKEAGESPGILRDWCSLHACTVKGRRQPFFRVFRLVRAIVAVCGERGRAACLEMLRPIVAELGGRIVADDSPETHKRLHEELCEAIQSSDRGEIETIRHLADGNVTAQEAEVIRQRAAEASLEWSEVAASAAEIAASGSAR